MKTYKKIDIYIDGVYTCSTNWSKTCKEAKARYCEATGAYPLRVRCFFAKGGE